MLLAQLHYNIEEVHRVQVELISQTYLWLDVSQVLVGSDLGNDVQDDLFYLIFIHLIGKRNVDRLVVKLFQDKNGIDSKHAEGVVENHFHAFRLSRFITNESWKVAGRVKFFDVDGCVNHSVIERG